VDLLDSSHVALLLQLALSYPQCHVCRHWKERIAHQKEEVLAFHKVLPIAEEKSDVQVLSYVLTKMASNPCACCAGGVCRAAF
jgi:hypothetical protein